MSLRIVLAIVLIVVPMFSIASGAATPTSTPSPTPQPRVTPRVSPPPPDCQIGAPPTPSQTQGPYWKTKSPARQSLLEEGITGTKLFITGYVLTTNCQHVAHAFVDFWQANPAGEYDNEGYRLRGHQFATRAGVYYIETVMPGVYEGRTRHIHVKVGAPNEPILTTQLYFPDEPLNQMDELFNPNLVMAVRNGAGGKIATFNFILAIRRRL